MEEAGGAVEVRGEERLEVRVEVEAAGAYVKGSSPSASASSPASIRAFSAPSSASSSSAPSSPAFSTSSSFVSSAVFCFLSSRVV